ETVFIGWSDESGEIVETNPRLTPQLAPKPEEGTRKAGPAAAPAAKKGPAAKADEKAPKLLDSIKPSPFGTERPLDAKYTANFVRMPEFHPEAKGPVHAHAGKKTFSETTEMNTEAVDTVGDVSVEAIAQEKLGEDVEVVAAYDITFTDGGAEVQPYNENPVTVTIEVGEELIGRSLTLLHISDDGVASVVEDAEFSEDGTVTFTANSFSVYVVVAEENPRVIVNFYDFDGGTTPLETMYVKKSDEDTDVDKIIFDPSEKVTVVTSGNEVFYGWATTASYTTAAVETALSIEDVRDEVKTKRDSLGTSDVTVDYYAIVCRKYSVDYLDDKNITLGSSEIRMLKTDPTSQQYTVNMVYTPGDSNHNFEGWKVSQGGTNIAGHDPAANDGQGTYYSNGTSITISGNVIFSVNAPSGQWLVYDENAPEGSKATYNAPRFLKSGDVTVDPNTADRPMTCVGYEFGGWFDSKEHADNLDSEEGRFSFGSPINDRTTVYARWSQKTKADYTIVIWKQNVNGFKKDDQGNPTTEKLYDFEEVITVKNANVGSQINVVSGTSGNASATVNQSSKSWTGFHYQGNDQQGKTVAADNSTIINVYFDRNSYTLTFQDNHEVTTSNNTQYTQYGWVDGRYVELTRYNNNWWYYVNNNWQQYTGTRYRETNTWTTVKTITALYQQDISGEFPIESSNGMPEYPTGVRWMPQGNLNVDGHSYFKTDTVVAYIDIMTPGSMTLRLNDPEGRTDKTMVYWIETLNGVPSSSTVATQWYGTGENRRLFEERKTVVAKYTGITPEDYIDLLGFRHFEADRTASGQNNYYRVGGSNSSVATLVNFYYFRNVYDLIYMDGIYVTHDDTPVAHVERSGPLYQETGIFFNADLTSYNEGGENYYDPGNSDDPDKYKAPEGFVFAGWYLDEACTTPCNFTNMSEGGIKVYAKWVQKEYRVLMHPNVLIDGEKDTTLEWGGNVSMSFKDAEGAKVSLPQGIRSEYELVGWFKDPNFSDPVDDKVALTAETTETYNKTEDTELDDWGIANPSDYNKDAAENRYWVVGKMELYAQWRKVLNGADGIGVNYDPIEIIDENTTISGTCGTDTMKYKDNASATAIVGAHPSDSSNYRFEYWVVQKWNPEANNGIGAYEDTNVHVYAGGSYDVLRDNARVIVSSWYNPNDPEDISIVQDEAHTKINEATYTVQLRAHYVEIDKELPTHIYWFRNDGSAAFEKYEELRINQPVNIVSAQERSGYVFKGWARVAIGDNPESAAEWESTETNWEQSNLTPYVSYEDGIFYYNGAEATQVAADEALPYHAMFAVWDAEVEVIVEGSEDEKPYNGSKQSNNDYTVKYKIGGQETNELPEGLSVVVTAVQDGTAVDPIAASGTNVGTYTATVTATISGTADGYVIKTDSANDNVVLNITPLNVTVTIEGKTSSDPYDGNEHRVTGYTCSADSTLINVSQCVNVAYDGTASASRTHVVEGEDTDGKTDMGLEVDKFSYSVTGTSNFNVSFELAADGWQEITPATLTITMENRTLPYNGQQQYGWSREDTGKETVEGLVNNETVTITYTPATGT
ncbi:MAG: hypothetical protein IJL91_13130, partial [Bacteroidales bacterium]|nr:hypothetical protein [Bacteroidales bacterium]